MEVTVNSDTRKLVDRAVQLKKEQQKLKVEMDAVTAELAGISERVLTDRGVKSTVVYGTGGNGVIVTSPVKINIVSYGKLTDSLGAALVNEYAPLKIVDPVREPEKNFLQMCSDVVRDYYMPGDLGQFLDEAFSLNAETKSVLLKKLKGVYDKDLKVLESVLGPGDYDVELFHIVRLLNYKRMRQYLPADMDSAIAAIKETVAVDEGVKAEIFFRAED